LNIARGDAKKNLINGRKTIHVQEHRISAPTRVYGVFREVLQAVIKIEQERHNHIS
jgi:hypothetical protein